MATAKKEVYTIALYLTQDEAATLLRITPPPLADSETLSSTEPSVTAYSLDLASRGHIDSIREALEVVV
jgi:hypothetical protein